MKKEWLVKTLALGVVVLFIGMSIVPLVGSLPIELVSTKKHCESNLAFGTSPLDVKLIWEAFKEKEGWDTTWYVKFTALCNNTSGIDRVEWDINDVVQYTDYESPYEWTIMYDPAHHCNITFKATAFDKAGNSAFDTINEHELIFPVMVVHVNEIYGTVDNPQYRPLDNVTFKIKLSFLGLIWFSYWSGTTDKYGTTEQVAIPDRDGNNGGIWIFPPTKYKITVSKDGYHTYRCLPTKIVKTTNLGRYDVNFTMAKDGSPFTKQISQNNQRFQKFLQFLEQFHYAFPILKYVLGGR